MEYSASLFIILGASTVHSLHRAPIQLTLGTKGSEEPVEYYPPVNGFYQQYMDPLGSRATVETKSKGAAGGSFFRKGESI